jgi:phage terminase large subunit
LVDKRRQCNRKNRRNPLNMLPLDVDETVLERPLPAAYYDPERLEVVRALNEALYTGVETLASANAPMYTLNPALKSFWRTRSRYKVLYGGRGSSKSHDAAGYAVFLAAHYTVKILCARKFQNKISESVYTLIKDKINASPFKADFEILKTSIRHRVTGSEFLFYGIERNLEEIKSTEGVDILWLEEAHYLNQEQWQTIEPTIRKEGSQVWLIFNPDQITDFIYQNFVVKPPRDTVKREINWQENPYLSETMLKIIYEYYRREPEEAQHVYGGVPRDGADKSVIPIKYVEAAINAHHARYKWVDQPAGLRGADLAKWRIANIKNPKHYVCISKGWEPSGLKRIGFDVADDGDDKCATVFSHGNVVLKIDEWRGLEDELLKSCTRVWNMARDLGSTITWDSIGVGAHCGAKFGELNDEFKRKIQYDPFNAGGRVDDPDGVYMKLPHIDLLNKDQFANIKAQKWDEVAARFRKTYEFIVLGIKHPIDELISIDLASVGEKLVEQLKFELASPRKDVDRMGKFKVESKDDMRDRGIKSPNVADALIMSMIRPKRAPATFFG